MQPRCYRVRYRWSKRLDRVVAILMGVAAFLRNLAATFDRLIEYLKAFIEFLDAEWPVWRQRWETQG